MRLKKWLIVILLLLLLAACVDRQRSDRFSSGEQAVEGFAFVFGQQKETCLPAQRGAGLLRIDSLSGIDYTAK